MSTVNPASPAAGLAEFIQRVPLLAEVPSERLLALLPACRVQRHEADADLFRQGDPADRVWIVSEGQVKIVRHDEGGREVILEVISPGEVFGGGAIFLPEHPATARSLTPTVTTVSFPEEAYAGLLLASPATALKVIRMLGARLHSTLRMNQLAGERVERRLAYILVKMAGLCGRPDREGTLLSVPLPRRDLADMAGTTVETAIRLMSRFHAEGIARTRRGGYIVLLDEKRLRQIARA
jgi:CRP-like cAMP-binding protein